MSAGNSALVLSSKQRRHIRRLQRNAHRQHSVLSQIERSLRNRSFTLTGIPTNVVELRDFFGRRGYSDGEGYYTEYTLRYYLDTEEWWLIRGRYYDRGYVGSGLSSRDASFWQTLRAIPSESLARAELQWGTAR